MIDNLSKLIRIVTANEKLLFLPGDVTALRMCGPCLRHMENSPSSSVFLKVKKTQKMSQPSQNGECTDQKKKQHSHQQKHRRTLSDAVGSPSTFPDEDPERLKHSKVTSALL